MQKDDMLLVKKTYFGQKIIISKKPQTWLVDSEVVGCGDVLTM